MPERDNEPGECTECGEWVVYPHADSSGDKYCPGCWDDYDQIETMMTAEEAAEQRPMSMEERLAKYGDEVECEDCGKDLNADEQPYITSCDDGPVYHCLECASRDDNGGDDDSN